MKQLKMITMTALMVFCSSLVFSGDVTLWKDIVRKDSAITVMIPGKEAGQTIAGTGNGEIFSFSGGSDVKTLTDAPNGKAVKQIILLNGELGNRYILAYTTDGGNIYFSDGAGRSSQVMEGLNGMRIVSLAYDNKGTLLCGANNGLNAKILKYVGKDERWQDLGNCAGRWNLSGLWCINDSSLFMVAFSNYGNKEIFSFSGTAPYSLNWTRQLNSKYNSYDLVSGITAGRSLVLQMFEQPHFSPYKHYEMVVVDTGVSLSNNSNNNLPYFDPDQKILYTCNSNIIYGQELGNPYTYNSKDAFPCGSISCISRTQGSFYIGTTDGGIYTKVESPKLSVSASYVSPLPDTNDAVYKVTIKGTSLNSAQMFKEGFNGISYDLSVPGAPGYKSEAYPLTGFYYLTDANNNGIVFPRETTIYFRGPADIKGKKLNVKQYAYSFRSRKESPVGDVSIDLPAATKPPVGMSHNYSISVTTLQQPQLGNIGTGTCAVPALVTIYNEKGEIDKSDSIYDKIYFTYSKDSGAGLLIEGDIYNAKKTNQLACMPQSTVELKKSAMAELDKANNGLKSNKQELHCLKYGIEPVSLYGKNGRIWYFFQGINSISEEGHLVANLVLADDDKGTRTSLVCNRDIVVPGAGSTKIVAQAPGDLKTSTRVNLTLPNSADPLDCSSGPQGDSENNFSGLLDFIVPFEGHNVSGLPQAVYFIFPCGLTANRSLKEKLDPSSLLSGYYFLPYRVTNGKAEYYQINLQSQKAFAQDEIPLPGNNLALQGKDTNAFLFDHQGRVAEFRYHCPITKNVDINIESNEKPIVRFRFQNYSEYPMLVYLGTNRPTHAWGLQQNWPYFFAPKSEEITFLSDFYLKLKSDSTPLTYGFSGRPITNENINTFSSKGEIKYESDMETRVNFSVNDIVAKLSGQVGLTGVSVKGKRSEYIVPVEIMGAFGEYSKVLDCNLKYITYAGKGISSHCIYKISGSDGNVRSHTNSTKADWTGYLSCVDGKNHGINSKL